MTGTAALVFTVFRGVVIPLVDASIFNETMNHHNHNYSYFLYHGIDINMLVAHYNCVL